MHVNIRVAVTESKPPSPGRPILTDITSTTTPHRASVRNSSVATESATEPRSLSIAKITTEIIFEISTRKTYQESASETRKRSENGRRRERSTLVAGDVRDVLRRSLLARIFSFVGLVPSRVSQIVLLLVNRFWEELRSATAATLRMEFLVILPSLCQIRIKVTRDMQRVAKIARIPIIFRTIAGIRLSVWSVDQLRIRISAWILAAGIHIIVVKGVLLSFATTARCP